MSSVKIPASKMAAIKQSPELVSVDLLRGPEIDSQPGGPVRQPYLAYRPARLHRTEELIPRKTSWSKSRYCIFSYSIFDRKPALKPVL